VSEPRRIRPFTNDEDDAGDEGSQNVGNGCAEFVAAEDDGGAQLAHATKFFLRMRRAGATYVKCGELEAQFGFPPPAVCKSEG
jgi:hypothetical protein